MFKSQAVGGGLRAAQFDPHPLAHISARRARLDPALHDELLTEHWRSRRRSAGTTPHGGFSR